MKLYLLFYSGLDRYVCDCAFIKEIIPQVQLKKSPHLPQKIIGLLNYGGSLIPVIDWCLLMDKRPASPSLNSRIIFLQMKTQLIGLLAEKVTETICEDPVYFINKDSTPIKNLPYLGGTLTDDKGMIQLVVVEKLFDAFNETFTGSE